MANNIFDVAYWDHLSRLKYFYGNEKSLIACAGLILVLIFAFKSVASIYINKINQKYNKKY